MAATNKYSAQNNKSSHASDATKKDAAVRSDLGVLL